MISPPPCTSPSLYRSSLAQETVSSELFVPAPLMAKKLAPGAMQIMTDQLLLGRRHEENHKRQLLLPKIKVKGELALPWQRIAFCRYIISHLQSCYGDTVRLDFFYSGGVTLKLCCGEECYPKRSDIDVKVFVTGVGLEVFDQLIRGVREYIHQLLMQQFQGGFHGPWVDAYCPEQFIYNIVDKERQLYRLSLPLGRDEDWLFIHEMDRGRLHSVRAKALLLSLQGPQLLALEGEVAEVLNEIKEGVVHTERPEEVQGRAVLSSLDLLSQGWRFSEAGKFQECIARILEVTKETPRMWAAYCMSHREGDYLGSLAFLVTSLIAISCCPASDKEAQRLGLQGVLQALGSVSPRVENLMKSHAPHLWHAIESLYKQEVWAALGELLLVLHLFAKEVEEVPRQSCPEDALQVLQSKAMLFLLLPRNGGLSFNDRCYIAAPKDIKGVWSLLKEARAPSWLYLQSPIQAEELAIWYLARRGERQPLIEWLTGRSGFLSLQDLSPIEPKALQELQAILREHAKQDPLEGDAKFWRVLRIASLYGGEKPLYLLLGDLLLQDPLFPAGIKIVLLMLKEVIGRPSEPLEQLYSQVEGELKEEGRMEAILAYGSLCFEVPALKSLPFGYLERIAKTRRSWLVGAWSLIVQHLPEEVLRKPYLEMFDQFDEEEKIDAASRLAGLPAGELLRQHLTDSQAKHVERVLYQLWHKCPFPLTQEARFDLVRWLILELKKDIKPDLLGRLLTLSREYITTCGKEEIKKTCGVFLKVVQILTLATTGPEHEMWLLEVYPRLSKIQEAAKLLSPHRGLLGEVLKKFSLADRGFIEKACVDVSYYDELFKLKNYDLCTDWHRTFCHLQEVSAQVKAQRTQKHIEALMALGGEACPWIEELWEMGAAFLLKEPKVKASLAPLFFAWVLQHRATEERYWWPVFSLWQGLPWKAETLSQGLKQLFALPLAKVHIETFIGMGEWLRVVDRMSAKEQKAHFHELIEWKYRFCQHLFACATPKIALEQQLEYVNLLVEKKYEEVKSILATWGAKLLMLLAQEPEHVPIKEVVRQGFYKLLSHPNMQLSRWVSGDQPQEEIRKVLMAVKRLLSAKVIGPRQASDFLDSVDAQPLEGEVLLTRKALRKLWVERVLALEHDESATWALVLLDRVDDFLEHQDLQAHDTVALAQWILASLAKVKAKGKVHVERSFIPQVVALMTYLTVKAERARDFQNWFGLFARYDYPRPLGLEAFSKLWDVAVGPMLGSKKIKGEEIRPVVQTIEQCMDTKETAQYVLEALEHYEKQGKDCPLMISDALLLKALAIKDDKSFIEIFIRYCNVYSQIEEDIFCGARGLCSFAEDKKMALAGRLIDVWKGLEQRSGDIEAMVKPLNRLMRSLRDLEGRYLEEALFRPMCARRGDQQFLLEGMVRYIDRHIDHLDSYHQCLLLMTYVIEEGISLLEEGQDKEWRIVFRLFVQERALIFFQMLEKEAICDKAPLFYEILFIASKHAMLAYEDPSDMEQLKRCAALYAQPFMGAQITCNREMLLRLGLQNHSLCRGSISKPLANLLLEDMLRCLDFFEGIVGCYGNEYWEPPKITPDFGATLLTWGEDAQVVKWPMLEVLAKAWVCYQHVYHILDKEEGTSPLWQSALKARSRILSLLWNGSLEMMKSSRYSQGLWMMTSGVHLFMEGMKVLNGRKFDSESQMAAIQSEPSLLEPLCYAMKALLCSDRPVEGLGPLCRQLTQISFRKERKTVATLDAKSLNALMSGCLQSEEDILKDIEAQDMADSLQSWQENVRELSFSWIHFCMFIQHSLRTELSVPMKEILELSHYYVFQANTKEIVYYSAFAQIIEHLVIMKQLGYQDWSSWFSSVEDGIARAIIMMEFLLQGKEHLDRLSFFSLWMPRADSHLLWIKYLDLIQEQIEAHQLQEQFMGRWMTLIDNLFQKVFSHPSGKKTEQNERMRVIGEWITKKIASFEQGSLLGAELSKLVS